MKTQKIRLTSHLYFRRILRITALILFVFSVLSCCLMYMNSLRITRQSIASDEYAHTEDLLRQADVFLSRYVAKIPPLSA